MITMSGVFLPLPGGKWRVPYKEDGDEKEKVFSSASEAVEWMTSIMRPIHEQVYRDAERLTGHRTEI